MNLERNKVKKNLIFIINYICRVNKGVNKGINKGHYVKVKRRKKNLANKMKYC